MNERPVEIKIGGVTLVGVRRSEYRRLVEGSSTHIERLKAQLEAVRKARAEMTKARDALRRELDELRSLRPVPGAADHNSLPAAKVWQTSTAEGAVADESFTMRRLGTTPEGGSIFSINADSSKSLRRILK